jgi:imidazolonepropionase-like amidohydrolase
MNNFKSPIAKTMMLAAAIVLENYVETGLTPLEALQSATLNAAIFLHKENELGTVEKGKLADLVILKDNPLKDISNTRKIYAVIMNGTLINNDKIDSLLRSLKGRAKQ